RILYVSDFDPSGQGMPTQVARNIEFAIEQYAPGADVKLLPVVLTKEQAAGLPASPVKPSDKSKDKFERLHGEVAAGELDALQVHKPGELARILRGHIEQYYDRTLAERLSDAEADAQERADDAWEAATTDLQETLDALKDEMRPILERHRDALAADLAPFAPRLQAA